MGEAKRRRPFEAKLVRIDVSATDNSAWTIVGSVLVNLADKLNAQLFLKEKSDGLLAAWPIDSVIGAAYDLEAVSACPVALETRKRPAPNVHWEFLVPDKLLIVGYATDTMARGLTFPGPIPPDDFPAHVRQFFKRQNPDGWASVLPPAWEKALSAAEGACRA